MTVFNLIGSPIYYAPVKLRGVLRHLQCQRDSEAPRHAKPQKL